MARRQTTATAATSEVTENNDTTASASDPEFRLAVEVLYHGARQGFFAGAHRWAMFATILLGASATLPFGGERICGLLAAAAAAADIAFDLTGRAQQHADLRRRYYEMVSEWTKTGEVADFGPRWVAISADEPPVHRLVEDMAYRNACISLGREPVPEPLPWPQRWTAHFRRG